MTQQPHILGIDIGGTKIAAAVVTPDGEPIGLTQLRTPAFEGAGAVINAALDAARAAMAKAPSSVVGCGIGTAGTVGALGQITQATRALPGWVGTDLRGAFGDALHLPVFVVNDVHAAAVGEGRYGAAVGYGDVLVVAVGTGIGGGILHAGELVRGRSGSAGSIGHLPVFATGTDIARRRCPCGGWDHLEAYASGPAIEAIFAEETGDLIGLPVIATRARAGDKAALAVIVESAEILGHALGAAANVLDPDMIVIAGGVAALEDLIAVPLRRALAASAAAGPDGVQLRFSALPGTATILGAAELARRNSDLLDDGRSRDIDLFS